MAKSKQYRISVLCQGVSPILINAMDDETLEGLRTKVRTQNRPDVPAKDVAEKKLYRDDDGRLGIPTANLSACLVLAGRNIKNGRKQISTATTTTMFSFLALQGEFIPFEGDAEQIERSWIVDKRRGRLPKDGTAVCLVRPKFKDWAFRVDIDVDGSRVSTDTVRQLVEEAGTCVGLGDFRPSCRGPFGRFKVVDWQVKELQQEDEQAA